MKKVCRTCSEEKPLDGFYKWKHSSDGHQASCKDCRNKKVREWTSKNKDRVRNNRNAKKKQVLLNAINLHGSACQLCGYNKDTRALIWHHKNKRERYLATTATFSQKKFQEELSNCVLMCANCHTILHREEYLA